MYNPTGTKYRPLLELKQWWSNLWESKGASNSSPPLPLIGSEVHSLVEESDSHLNQDDDKGRLYWISFRNYDDSFFGIVIARGKSPGAAASTSIDRLDLPTTRASIVAIPLNREREFESHQDRLLDEKSATELAISLDISMIRS